MLAMATEHGYQQASVARVIAHAGVSRPTFYEYFSDREECFVVTQGEIAENLLGALRLAVDAAPAQQALQAVLEGLLDFTHEWPADARLLFCEALAAGPRALDERDRTIARSVEMIERAQARSGASSALVDAPLSAVLGAAHWLLARRIRRGERDLGELRAELVSWAQSYERPRVDHRWGSLRGGPFPPRSRFSSELPSGPPAALAAGRSRLSRAEVARNQRERILYATAEVCARNGYNASSVAEIVAAASLDTRVFYSHFSDKQHAFLAAHELGFQHTMAVAASAFFSAESWPERTWQGVLAGSQFQATHPALTHLLYVQSYAIGAPAVQRIDESHAAFTIFLLEGNELAEQPRSQIAMEAIVAASFQIAFAVSRGGRGEQMPSLAPLVTYLCLAPFLGADAASSFVDQKAAGE
ncbi:MAG: TetR/AcrR family transcriptional regulator [Solirubrobacteraceae bacterium]